MGRFKTLISCFHPSVQVDLWRGIAKGIWAFVWHERFCALNVGDPICDCKRRR